MGRNAYLAVGTVFWIVATGLYVSSMLTKNWRSSDSDSYNLFDMCNFLGCTSFGKWQKYIVIKLMPIHYHTVIGPFKKQRMRVNCFQIRPRATKQY